MLRSWLAGVVLLSMACMGSRESDECPVCPEPTAGLELTDFESTLVDPVLEDIRAGVRAWDDQSVGICLREGKRDCASFLGTTPGELPPGEYMISAILRVPDVGEEGTWTTTVNVDCTTTRELKNGSSAYTNNYNKTYTVEYVGKERGYRLAPLYTITSPSSSGKRTCTYTVEMAHPDNPAEIEGSWSVPARE